MKKLFTVLSLILVSFAVQAQSRFDPLADKETFTEIMRSTVIIIIIYLVTVFILSFVRLILNDRLKKAMLEKGTPADIIATLLPQQAGTTAAIKWFCILTAVSIGLTILSFTMPTGIYAAIVMAFSIALGFLAYYFLAKRLNN